MIKRFTLFLVASAVVMVCRDAVAQPVYSVNIVGLYQFPFPPGTALVGQTETNGMTWAGAGPAGPPISIASNSLAVAGLASPAGHKARLAGVNGPAARIALSSNLNSGTIYYSLALRVADLGTLDANGGTLAALNNATGASANLPAPLAARLMIRAGGAGFGLGIAPTSSDPPTFGPTDDCVVGNTEFVVLGYTFVPGPANDVVRLWVNPSVATFGASNAPPPHLTATSSNDVNQISSFVLMQRPQPILPAVTFVDEVRVGTTWASVTPPATADLAVRIGSLPAQIQEGDVLPVSITASNLGPDTATSVQVTFSLPTGVVLQSVTNDHGSCTVQGSNVTCSANALAPEQSLNVLASLQCSNSIFDEIEDFELALRVQAGAAESDPNPPNNLADAVVRVVPDLDFGDARPPYPVTRAENGARHRNGSVYRMGANFDREADGVHSPNADADDLAGAPSDEDGVVLPGGPFVAGHTHAITVSVPVAGYLDAFFDFNNDGDWNDPGERVTPAGGSPIGPGAIPVPVGVPISAVTGSPHARFRFSDVGGLGPTGFHPVGEVVDRPVEIRRMDFGNAPDPTYPTLLANDGARHVVSPGFQLGTLLDYEGDGPDGPPLNDEDGLLFVSSVFPGAMAEVRVTTSGPGELDAFLDFNHNGAWEDPSERIGGGSVAALGGVTSIFFTVPSTAVTAATWMRIRFSGGGGLGPTGPAGDGEVEDYPLQIQAPPDLGLVVSASPNPVTDTSNLTYSVTVTNQGGGAATATALTLPLPEGITFVSAISSQGACSNSALGVRCMLGTVPAGGTASVAILGNIAYTQLANVLNVPESQETISVSNSVSVVSVETDANPLDNTAAVIAMVLPLRDWGDAITPPYPVLGPAGARHKIGALRFGTLIDAEPNGLPVDQDDLTGVDDEIPDGFGLAAGYYAGGWTPITLQVSGPAAYIDMWFDTDGIAGWGAADQVMTAVAHPGGGAAVGYMIALPPGAVVGATWARARVHLNPAGLPTTGYGGGGEVVDFQVNILPAAVDLLVVANPAQITVTEGDLLTQTITVSNKGPSNATATRLGVHFPPGATLENLNLSQGAGQMEGTNLVCNLGTLAPNASARVTFTAGTSNIFAGRGEEFWDFDWWLTANETELNPDDNVPVGIVRVIRRLDFPDAPASYGTLRVDDAARHGGATNCLLILGSHIDRERDGHPSADALGDDNHQSPDDEDGIVFLDPLVPGAVARVQVTVNIIPAACWNCAVLNAWVDFNRNGVFDLASDRIVQDLCLPSGTHVLSFTVPAGASNGVSYARFRLTSTTGTTPLGYKPDGEVEDYRVTIGEAIGTRRWIALDGQAAPGTAVNVEVLQATATQTRVRLTVPGVWLITDWYAGQRFYHLEFVPGEFKGVGFPEGQGARSWYDFPADSGQPLLPGQRYRRAFNITPVQANFPESALGRHPRTAAEMEALGIDPAGARPAIPALRALLAVSRQTTANDLGMQTLNRQFHDLHLNAALKPAGFEGLDQQAPDVSEGYTPPQLVDETFYGSFTGQYAGTEATFSAVSGMGGFAGVQVRVPLMQATSPQDVQVVASMEIQFDHRVAVVDLACPPQYDVWTYKMPYVNGAAIVDGLTARGLAVSAVRAARYLIITPRDWVDSFTDFASWKASKGLNVDYAYVGETVASDRASIDAYIESYYATHWCRGVYVLLAGDVDVIESGRSAYTDIDTDAESDHVYEVIGGDTVASVYVGRLSANTEEELQTQLAKILSYERDPVPGDWPYYITLAANSQNDDETYGVSASFPSKYAACINEIAAYDYNPYLSGSFQVLHAGAASEADPRAVNQDVIDAINAGRGQVLYRGHGSSSSWGSGWDGSSTYGASWTASTHVPQLNNTAYPIIYGIACQNNHIDSSDSLGETFMSRAGGGAVAYFGASLNSYTSENHERAKGIFKAQWDSGIRTLGPMLAEAERFSSLSSVESQWLNNTFGYLLLGDPEMSVKPPATILDMSLYVDSSNVEVFEGDPHVFSLTVSNGATFTATGVELRATLPLELTVQSITSSQGSCSVQGREVVCALASLDAQRSATVQVTVGAILTTRPTQEFIDLASFSWGVSGAGTDRHLDDNQARTTVRVRRKLDYPDAPVSYGTLRVDNAARHGGDTNCLLILGANIDREPDGQPSPLADGDDIHGGPDDGDGITFLDPLIPGATVRVRVVVNIIPAACWNCAVLNAWVDFNGNGAFDLVSDRIIHDQCLPAGTHVLSFTVPANSVSGASFARFRLTSATGVTPLGFQPDGEVEDYPVTVTFPPIVAFSGLQHEALGGATVFVNSNGLRIANLGTNGQDGVRINLGRAEGWGADISQWDTPNGTFSVALRGSIGGQSNQPINSLLLERAGSNLVVSADFSGLGASQYVAEYYDQSGVRRFSLSPTSSPRSIFLWGYICHIEVLADSIYILVCDGEIDDPGLPDDVGGGIVMIRLSAVTPAARPDFASAVEISGTGSLTLGSEALRQFGLWHRFLGGAISGGSLTTGAEPWNLCVGTIGASGQDGIETMVGGPEYIGELPAGNLLRQRVVQAWPDDWTMPWLTSSNSHVRWTVTGRISNSSFRDLGDLTMFRQEQGTSSLSARFDGIGATQVLVEVFNGPAFVGSVTLPVGDLGTISTGSVRRVTAQIIDDVPVWNFCWDEGWWLFRPRDGSLALRGDRLRINPLNPTTTVEGLRSLITRGANVESFAFRGFNTAAPQQPRLGAPRFIPGGGITLPIATEADVTFQIEASSSVNGPWTPIGQVMGTDGVSETDFEDTVPHISNSIRLFRIRIR